MWVLWKCNFISCSMGGFSGCDTTSCFEGKGTLKKHNIFSATGFVHYFKFCPIKTVLADKIHAQSKVMNIPTNVQSISWIFP